VVRLRFLPRWVAWALVLTATNAFAQAPSDAEAEAKAAMKRGIAAFARRDAETALAEYRKAERLVPDANVPHRYAAEALVELERYEDAIEEYETYLRIKPDVSDAAEVRKRMENARAKIDGTVDVRSTPAGAAVLVDGASAKAGDTPLTGLKLKQGSHTIVLRLPDRKDVVLSPVVRGGETLALEAHFSDASVREGHRSMRSTLGWVALGTGGAVLGAALVVDVFVLSSAFNTFEDKRRVDDPSAADALSHARHLQVAAVVGYAAGGVLAATGAVLLLWPGKTDAPVKAGVGLGGAVVSGRF
jgi:tetratricopeptide (TPR) repeat protein